MKKANNKTLPLLFVMVVILDLFYLSSCNNLLESLGTTISQEEQSMSSFEYQVENSFSSSEEIQIYSVATFPNTTYAFYIVDDSNMICSRIRLDGSLDGKTLFTDLPGNKAKTFLGTGGTAYIKVKNSSYGTSRNFRLRMICNEGSNGSQTDIIYEGNASSGNTNIIDKGTLLVGDSASQDINDYEILTIEKDMTYAYSFTTNDNYVYCIQLIDYYTDSSHVLSGATQGTIIVHNDENEYVIDTSSLATTSVPVTNGGTYHIYITTATPTTSSGKVAVRVYKQTLSVQNYTVTDFYSQPIQDHTLVQLNGKTGNYYRFNIQQGYKYYIVFRDDDWGVTDHTAGDAIFSVFTPENAYFGHATKSWIYQLVPDTYGQYLLNVYGNTKTSSGYAAFRIYRCPENVTESLTVYSTNSSNAAEFRRINAEQRKSYLFKIPVTAGKTYYIHMLDSDTDSTNILSNKADGTLVLYDTDRNYIDYNDLDAVTSFTAEKTGYYYAQLQLYSSSTPTGNLGIRVQSVPITLPVSFNVTASTIDALNLSSYGPSSAPVTISVSGTINTENITSLASKMAACGGAELTLDLSNASGITTLTGTQAERGVFKNCTTLKTLILPNSMTSIGENAFLDCTSLTSVTIPSSVTRLERCSFCGCTGLTQITIPSSVTYIGESAFNKCENLSSISLSQNLTQLGNFAFAYCKKLTSVTLPAKTTRIGKNAFVYSGLATLITSGTWKATTDSNFVATTGCPSFSYTNSTAAADKIKSGSNYYWYK